MIFNLFLQSLNIINFVIFGGSLLGIKTITVHCFEMKLSLRMGVVALLIDCLIMV